jgi:2-iminobutanoate/2-iminopropanoate deaminase
MTRIIGVTTDAPQPSGNYSPAARIAGVVWTAGQGGFDPLTRVLVGDDVATQTRQALRNCESALRACGASLDDAVRVGVFLADLDTRAEMDAVFTEFWPVDPPARTTVGVELPGEMQVEIDIMACISEPHQA